MLWDYMLYFAFSYYSIIMNIFNNCKLYLLRVIYNMLHVTLNVILFEVNMLNGMVTGSRCIPCFQWHCLVVCLFAKFYENIKNNE